MGDSKVDDNELAARIGRGDEDALQALYRTHGGAVKNIAMRVLRDESLAEDVVQDTFVTFWRDTSRFDPSRGSLRTFLLTLAHRRAVDVVRSEEARTRRQLIPPDPDHYRVEDEVWSRQLSDRVRQALAALNEDEREAIALAYFGGLSYVETATRLRQPEGTVKSRIRSGMRKLATALQEVRS